MIVSPTRLRLGVATITTTTLILGAGVERARSKLEYTTLATAFGGPTFTVADRRRVYRDHLGHCPRCRQLPLAFTLQDAAAAVAALRAEGRTVLLHCVQAQSRTPTVATLYGARVTSRTPTACLADVRRALPGAVPDPTLLAELERLG